MHKLLSQIDSPLDLSSLSTERLNELASEMRDALCNLVAERSAHFASNLGVVELCIALHASFDFRKDRLIWDTGHQIYPHKLLTGRYHEFSTIRTKGGLMGYPNPQESPYDLFMTGHAGCSVSTVLGLKSGDDLLGHQDHQAVAVIGDGAFPSGIVYEAMNNTLRRQKKFLIVLNDNRMSICPRVGGMADYLDRLRTNPYYTGFKNEVVKILNKVPVFGDPVERFLAQLKEGVKAGLHGGMLFEDLGFRYLGPIDGHNIAVLKKYLDMVKDFEEPVLLHVVTEKGHGFQPAAADPVYFHTPPAFTQKNGKTVPNSKSAQKVYTHYASDAILQQMRTNPKVTVMTAAMCQGNKLEPIREEFSDRFFDTGICESHTVAFAAGQAKAGLRPIVDIYSTFLQRGYDQLFQEVALQNLPVTFMLDRAGLTGPDGPTHHGAFDLGYMRLLPNMVVMAPGHADVVQPMVEFALNHSSPCSLRYPKTTANVLDEGQRPPVELGKADIIRQGQDGGLIACGTLLSNCLETADQLAKEGLNLTVIDARFIKPLDTATFNRAIQGLPFIVTVEEAALAGGFGSAVLEAASEAGLDTRHVRRLGIPDRFIEHGDRAELLSDLGLDTQGILQVCRQLTTTEKATAYS